VSEGAVDERHVVAEVAADHVPRRAARVGRQQDEAGHVVGVAEQGDRGGGRRAGAVQQHDER
jgi:hypothetical protein